MATKKMKKKIIKSIITISLVIITAGILVVNTTPRSLNEDEKIEILNEIKLYEVKDNKTLEDLEKKIDKYIDSYDEKDRDIMVDKYIFEAINSTTILSEKLTTIGFELEEVVNKYGVDVNDPKTYKKIPDTFATVKGFLKEVNEKGFSLEKPKGAQYFTINLNSEELNSKYGNKVSDSLSAFLEFNEYEFKSEPFINVEEKSINIDEVAKRINMLEEGLALDKKQEYVYINNWTEPLSYYYSILLGLSHDYFLSGDKLPENIYNNYKSIQEKYKDTTLGNVLKDVIDIYDKSKMKVSENEIKAIMEISEKKIFTEEIKKALENFSIAK